MDFIKNVFNKVVGWIAYPFAKAQDKITELLGPAIVHFDGEHKIKWNWKCVAKCILGVMLLGVTSVIAAATGVMTIVGLTLLFGLVLPSLLANGIAVFLTIALMFRVYEVARLLTAEEISIEVEVETV